MGRVPEGVFGSRHDGYALVVSEPTADAGGIQQSGKHGPVLDEATVTSAHRVLEQLQIRGGVTLQRDAACMRDELALARGLSLAQVLAGPRPPAPADHVPSPRLASV